jgi:phage portal protein BeeE
MAIAASRYGSKAFQSGGIPPAVLQGPFQSGAAANRASEDVAATTLKLAKEGRPIMALPLGHELKTIGFTPENMQLLNKFMHGPITSYPTLSDSTNLKLFWETL